MSLFKERKPRTFKEMSLKSVIIVIKCLLLLLSTKKQNNATHTQKILAVNNNRSVIKAISIS